MERLSQIREKRDGLLEFAGFCLGNCFWAQWGGSKALGRHVVKGDACEVKQWIEEVSEGVIHRSIETG